MKRVKQTAGIVLALVLGASVLAACSEGAAGTSQAENAMSGSGQTVSEYTAETLTDSFPAETPVPPEAADTELQGTDMSVSAEGTDAESAPSAAVSVNN